MACDNIVVNSLGGKQSKVECLLTAFPALAMLRIGEILHEGEVVRGYGRGNWQLISLEDHVCHALVHLAEYMAQSNNFADDRWSDAFKIVGEDHLGHAACRLLFALHLRQQDLKDQQGAGY